MPDAPACRVLYAGNLVIDQRWAWRLCDPFWRLYCNRDHGAAVATAARRVALSPGRVVLVPAWADARGTCTARVRHFYVHFETPGLPDAWLRTHCPEPLPLAHDRALAAMLADLVDRPAGPDPQAPHRDQAWFLRVQAAAGWALAQGLERIGHGALAALAAQAADPLVEAARRTIDQRLDQPLSVPALARAAGLSDDHFARRFHQATGRTVMRWIQERRIAAAADRLIHGDEPIEDLARGVGFANRFHFTRVFTRLIGTAPGTYRRQHQGRSARPPGWAG